MKAGRELNEVDQNMTDAKRSPGTGAFFCSRVERFQLLTGCIWLDEMDYMLCISYIYKYVCLSVCLCVYMYVYVCMYVCNVCNVMYVM